jgi:hypothetical protein
LDLEFGFGFAILIWNFEFGFCEFGYWILDLDSANMLTKWLLDFGDLDLFWILQIC